MINLITDKSDKRPRHDNDEDYRHDGGNTQRILLKDIYIFSVNTVAADGQAL